MKRRMPRSVAFPDPINGSRWIALTKGKFALVDEADFESVDQFNWCVSVKGAVVRRIGNRVVYLHRWLLNAPESDEVDHWNRNPLDNRRFNLRLASHLENTRNRGPDFDGSSIFKGVSWDKRRNHWRATINFEGKQIHLGSFQDQKLAACAYNEAAKVYFGEFAYLNQVIL